MPSKKIQFLSIDLNEVSKNKKDEHSHTLFPNQELLARENKSNEVFNYSEEDIKASA